MSPRLRFWSMVALFLLVFLAACAGADWISSHLEAGRAPGELISKFWSDGKNF